MKFSAQEINSKNTWQIGTGDDTRMYHDVFIKYGVAFVGPGDPGIEGDPETALFYKNNPKVKNWGAVLKQVKVGDWMIARKGKSTIVALGKVVSGYNHSEFFGDVEGWCLQHYVRVEWYRANIASNRLEIGSNSLSQSTLQRCASKIVLNKIYNCDFVLAPEPTRIEQVELIQISELVNELIERGIRIQDSENIGVTLARIIRLAQYYEANDGSAPEAEIVSFLVVPFLIAIGWSEQKIKMEYNRIDIALFTESFKGNYLATPNIIIEAKKIENGLAFTDKQIDGYSKLFPRCKKFVATNGYRYVYSELVNGKLVSKGYFNLLRLSEREQLRSLPLTSIETILQISNFQN